MITAELKKLSAAELRAAGPAYREMLAARDMEDFIGGGEEEEDDEDAGAVLGEDRSSCSCLFGNPCASPANCKDWRNRFEVAKRNGWKGF